MTKPLSSAEESPPWIRTPKVLEHIRETIKTTVTPSWLHSVPSNFGDAKAGTLSADQWRSLALVYLPLALVKSWGEGSSPPEDATYLRDVLDHTMALFSAVRLACLRTTTEQRLEAYRVYITQYVQNFPSLYHHAMLRPNHHMAQHIYHFLQLFGPVQSWWCFPFERLVGILQRTPHNHKFGECRSNLRLIDHFTDHL
jgi:hypothetical protein